MLLSRRFVRNLVVRSSALVSVLVLVIGALHLPWARSWLRRAGGCPVPRLTAAQVEMAQASAFLRLRGPTAAAEHPALAFALDESTREDVVTWARERGISCEPRRDGTVLICADVRATEVPAGSGRGRYDELAFGFRLRDLRLVNVAALRTGLSAAEAERELRRISARLEMALGAPAAKIEGDPAVVVHRHSDYLAEVSAMSLRGRGHALREHYMSAPR